MCDHGITKLKIFRGREAPEMKSRLYEENE